MDHFVDLATALAELRARGCPYRCMTFYCATMSAHSFYGRLGLVMVFLLFYRIHLILILIFIINIDSAVKTFVCCTYNVSTI